MEKQDASDGNGLCAALQASITSPAHAQADIYGVVVGAAAYNHVTNFVSAPTVRYGAPPRHHLDHLAAVAPRDRLRYQEKPTPGLSAWSAVTRSSPAATILACQAGRSPGFIGSAEPSVARA